MFTFSIHSSLMLGSSLPSPIVCDATLSHQVIVCIVINRHHNNFHHHHHRSVPSPFPHGIHSWVKNGEAGTFKGLCKYTTLVRSDQTQWFRMDKRASSSYVILCVLSPSLVSLGPAIWRLMQSSTTDVEPTLFPFFFFCFHCMLRCFADDEILPRIAATSQFLSYSSLTTVSACHWSRQNGLSAAIGRHTIVLLSYWSTQNSVVLPLVGKCLEDSQVSEWTKIMTDLFQLYISTLDLYFIPQIEKEIQYVANNVLTR